MKQPFFANESDSANMRRLEELQTACTAKDQEIKSLKQKITKDEAEERKLTLEIRKNKDTKEHLSNEITKMKAMHDPSSLSLQDIIPKLQALDPVRFREVMHDLEYEG